MERKPLRFVYGARFSVPRGSYCPMDSHPGFEIVYHPSGEGVTSVECGRKIHFQSGSAIVYPPNLPHDQLTKKSGEDFCVQIAPPEDASLVPLTGLHIPLMNNTCIQEDIHFLSWGYPSLSDDEQFVCNLRATASLLQLIRIAIKESRGVMDPAERHVMDAEQYIRDYYASIESLLTIAASVGVNYDYLRHEFKSRRGVTLIRYLNTIRVERAKTFLKHSRIPLKEVARICGFKDEYYFSVVFRKFVKTSPGTFRNTQQTDGKS